MNIRTVVKKCIPLGLFQRIEPLGHLVEAIVYNLIYGFPGRRLRVIGVTGTDGKTTTSTALYRAMTAAGYKTALLTTALVDYADGQGERPSPTHMTTAGARALTKQLRIIAKGKPDWVVLETSSHALAQNRVWGINYEVGIVTNISHEHLDYHKTMDRYIAAKRALITHVARSKRGLQTAIINADDTNLVTFTGIAANTVTYGIDSGDVRATNISLNPEQSRFTVADQDTVITSKLSGRFNVYNVLAVLCALRAIGTSEADSAAAIAAVEPVVGRMAPVIAGQSYTILVDYAVTPAALESVLSAARELATGKVGIVFGATGSRDTAKRPVMGKVVAELADRIYLTDDETYAEDPASIRAAVFAGIVDAGGAGKCQEFNERRRAIEVALKDAQKGDIVVLTGLGHQTDRNMGGVLEPWNDEAVVRSILQQG